MPTTGNGCGDRVAQASGMVSVQAHGNLAAAITLMKTRAIETELRGARVLDVACGHGRASRGLARLGADVVGVDISAELIASARLRDVADTCGIDYHAADIAAPDNCGTACSSMAPVRVGHDGHRRHPWNRSCGRRDRSTGWVVPDLDGSSLLPRQRGGTLESAATRVLLLRRSMDVTRAQPRWCAYPGRCVAPNDVHLSQYAHRRWLRPRTGCRTPGDCADHPVAPTSTCSLITNTHRSTTTTEAHRSARSARRAPLLAQPLPSGTPDVVTFRSD